MKQIGLYDALRSYARQGGSIIKHLRLAGIKGWEDVSNVTLLDLRAEIAKSLAPNTARTYFSELCKVLEMFRDMHRCEDFRKILKSKQAAVVKTYLDPDELGRLERVTVKTRNEAVVLHQFLIGAYTGMRWSDVQNVTDENVADGLLTYVSVKTATEATVPVSQRILDYIHDTQGENVARTTFNRVISALCRRAGIDRQVKIYRAGRERSGPKWMFVTSHTARVSFCTNLSGLGVELAAIAQLAGHSDVKMTERYVAKGAYRLPKKAMEYLKGGER